MSDYEKLGAFYLGKSFDLATNKRGDDLILYDSKDLTTHAVIIGMTGSGKTGLGIGLIEEAAIDRVPVIAIDPKGDLGNLLLTFPNLQPADLRPWVSPQEAATRGVTPEVLAEETAATWKKGLEDWGQSGERIRAMRQTTDFAIYTPGSTAATPISVLASFKAPPQAVRDDADLFRERIQSTASSVLGLMGIDADPVTSREHVLIANIIQNAWVTGKDLDIAGLIRAIQQPPMRSIGVLDVDSFFPPKERGGLAMQLNTLLAAPGFEVWMQGEPLDAGRLFYTASGQPRVSVISIAHLSDRERMFFVSMLLNEIVSWMRTQPGTGSLRAMLYMDEIAGYMPPTAVPPSKPLLLTLLKQARAFGLGVVLSTQNPVDLDYKGLSNIGTWFIGRLQTERDKARVMEGLEGAAAGGDFDRNAMERTLAGLGKRVFLMRNVHEDEPVVFTTRWTLSYLAGPLTRDQIKALVAAKTPAASPPVETPWQGVSTVGSTASIASSAPAPATTASGPPLLPQGIAQYFVPPRGAGSGLVYTPMAVAAADVAFENTRYGVSQTNRSLWLCPVDDGPVPVDWQNASVLDLAPDDLERDAPADAHFAELPQAAANAKSYGAWEKQLERWLRGSQALTLWRSPTLKAVSQANEDERDFRIRLQQQWREERDDKVEALRKRYATRIATINERLRKAEQAVAREQQEASQQKWSAAASVGGSILGALFGRKSTSAVSRIGSSIGRMQKQSGDIGRAEENVQTLNAQLAEIEAELQAETATIDSTYDALTEQLEPITVSPKATDVHVHFVGLAWAPHRGEVGGMIEPAW